MQLVEILEIVEQKRIGNSEPIAMHAGILPIKNEERFEARSRRLIEYLNVHSCSFW